MVLKASFQPKPFYDYQPTLFSACQASPGELVFNSDPTKEETCVQTVEAQEDDQSAGEAACRERLKKLGLFCPEEEKIQEDCHQDPLVTKATEGREVLSSQRVTRLSCSFWCIAGGISCPNGCPSP